MTARALPASSLDRPAAGSSTAGQQRAGGWQAAGLLLVAGAAALAVRLAVAGGQGVASVSAGLVFAGLLWLVHRSAPAGGPALGRLRPAGTVLAGVAVAAALCVVPVAVHLRGGGSALPAGEFPIWAVVVTAVAVAEEAVLRGSLWSAVARAAGTPAALVVSTAAFALLHVPLYGWTALPFDVAAGLLLGGLRLVSGGWAASGVAHALADLAGWWVR